MKVAVFLLALAFAAVAVAQEEYKCESPPAWYADYTRVNPQQRAFEYGRFYYDEEHQRLARKENVTANGTDYVYGEIFLHEEKKGYRYNIITKECRSFTLTEPFPMIGPSENDKFDGNFVIGSSAGPKDGVYVSAYSGTSDRGRFSGVWIPMGQEGGTKECLPVSEIYARLSEQSVSITRYYNIRLGIFDYSVFTPPEYC